MATIPPRQLVDKLNQVCRAALEAAAGLCMSKTNFYVEIEHWLMKLLDKEDTDLTRIFRHFDVDLRRVSQQLSRAIEGFRTGNGRAPALSEEIYDLMREAWLVGSLSFSMPKIRSGLILYALLTDQQQRLRLQGSCPEAAKISPEKLGQELGTLLADTIEDEPAYAPVAGGEPGTPGQGAAAAASSRTPHLDQYTINLTEVARQGKLDPVVGRDAEIRQVIDILTRRRQNNPILAGEAGVGKTAVVEGFALRIASKDVPLPLQNADVRTLDLGLLQAGAGVKGEFENRLKNVIAEVKASVKPIILFIDEAHTLMGAGGGQGMGDAANLLKPALARGELRTIAATTWAEYKKSFETDPALKRRFQVVKVEEPDEKKAILMMRGIVESLEKHHKVRILDEAVEDAVKLSHRYITDRQLPDKSVSLLDTACARVGLSQSATPAALEDARREIETLQVEILAVEKEIAVGADLRERLTELQNRLHAAEQRRDALEKRLVEEKKLVEEIKSRREKLEKHAQAAYKLGKPAAEQPKPEEAAKLQADLLTPEDENQLKGELAKLKADLIALQGEQPLIFPVVDSQAVAEVVSGWTGIPMGKMVLDEIKTVLTLRERLEERVVGQGHALEALAQRIKTSRAGLADPRRPIGVFLLVGPSGVGKTETAVALSEILYGGDRNMVVINMSEYKEEHKISRLTGSAPGYVGYGEGGVLTEAVRRKPYSIVLLDEVEKAHESVQEIFYQVFDKGMLQDDKGEEINFKNTIILLTANVASDTIMKLCADPDTMPDAEGLAAAIRPDLLKVFKPALLGRINVLPYFPLGDEVLKKIIHLKLKQIAERVKANHRAQFLYDEALVNAVVSRCKEVETGARNVDHILTGTVLPTVSKEVLTWMAEGRALTRVKVGVNDKGDFVYEVA
jgi:type VI secretion system protein VasG